MSFAYRQSLHPSWQELASFDLGQLPDAAWAAVEQHLSGCETCGQLLDTVPRDSFVRELRPVPQVDSVNGEQETDLPTELIGHPRYRVLEPLGAGGMGAVFKAEHLLMGRLVAIKVCRPDARDRSAAIGRLTREVKALAKLSHPNLVTAFDAEQIGDALYVVMEYVPGETLDQIIRRCKRLPPEIATQWIGQAATGLQYACEHGLVHRDLKPSNLIVTPEGQVKILDFGLARCSDESDAGTVRTPDGSIVGTPAYAAPEQARAPKNADIRSDLYSLGCTWYEMLTGLPPFPGGTAVQQLLAHQDQKPRPVTQVRADLPPAMDGIFHRLLAKNPAERFQTPGEFLEAVQQLEHQPPDSRPPRHSRWLLPTLSGLAVTLLLLLGFGGWQLFRYLGFLGTTNTGQKVEPQFEPQVTDSRRPNGSTIAGWGTVIDPDGDCRIDEANGVVSITIPGTLHGINPTKERFSAPRILRPIEGDFHASVRVFGNFAPRAPSTTKRAVPFNAAGLLLYADDLNLLWIARNRFIGWPKSDDLCFAPLFELFEDARPLKTNPERTSSTAFKGFTTSLHLERKGNVLRGAYSNDGMTWEGWRETSTRLPKKLQIGVVAVSTSSQPFSVTFAEFKVLAK